jgi:hypothetical protein
MPRGISLNAVLVARALDRQWAYLQRPRNKQSLGTTLPRIILYERCLRLLKNEVVPTYRVFELHD